MWEQSGCSCVCFHLPLDSKICVHHLKRLSVYVKDESLDSTSLGSSPQLHWMLKKGMVGLIGWWDGQSLSVWRAFGWACEPGLVFFFFLSACQCFFSFGKRRVSAVLLLCRLHVLSFIIFICFIWTFWCLVHSVLRPVSWQIQTCSVIYFTVFPFRTNLFPIFRTDFSFIL